MRLLPVFLTQSALAADTSPEKALSTCKEFFGEEATSSRLGEGEQAVVYKCENSTLTSALKIYKKPHELVGEPEFRIKVDRAVGDAGNGPAFYGSKTEGFPINYEVCGNFDNCEPGIPEIEYVNCGNFDACGDNLFYAKFEEFLSGKNVDVKDLHKPETYMAVATRLAELHQMTKEEIDIPIKFCSEPWPWNTNALRVHLSNPLFEKGLEYINDNFKKDPIEDEKASFTCLKDIYDFAVQNVEMSNSPVVMTHQDVHAGNIFLKNGGENDTLLDRLMLTDYDNAGFGPRAWDLLYYFFNWQSELDSDAVNLYLGNYTDAYNALNPPRNFTIEEVEGEFVCYMPWYVLERSAFLYALNPDWGKGFNEVLRGVLSEFAAPDGYKCTKGETYAEYPQCETQQSDNTWDIPCAASSPTTLALSLITFLLVQFF